MRAPLNWLEQYCNPELTASELAERLALTGTEVDRISHHGVGGLEHLVVGKVLTCERHPDADRLSVCSVDTGAIEPSQIVCGAPNVAAGQTVAVARPGSIMLDGTKLKKAKLRGKQSAGMILSAVELALGNESDGIMVLDDGLAAGTPLAEALPISTEVLELEITPNRPDCLSIYGVAREVSAATGTPLAAAPYADDPHPDGDQIPGVQVDIQAPDLCLRYTARLFEDVSVGPSPLWLQARLIAAGQRPISNVVDITNYVTLLTGQPLHAFDADLVAGGRLTVRRAHTGETLTTLDESVRKLDPEMVVIEDAEGLTSLAGIMGGARSEVGSQTGRVLMEAATWDGPSVQRTSARLGLRTEASSRFEKQVSPEQAIDGQALASKLLIELCGARPVGGTIDVGRPGPQAATIRLRDARCRRLLGVPVPREESAQILSALGFTVKDANDGLDVTVPSWRRIDVTREADLIEEVARIWGLGRFPDTLPSRRGAIGRLAPEQRARRRAEDALLGAGLSEAVGWSFSSPEIERRLGLAGEPVALENPMSEEQSIMRRTLTGSLLDALRRNRARGIEAVRLFEYGAVYERAGADGGPTGNPWYPVGDPGLPRERTHIGALLTGALRPPSWADSSPAKANFFAAKGVLQALLDTLRIGVEFLADRAPLPYLHPRRCARVSIDKTDIGWLAEIHPEVARRWDLDAVVAGFELDFGALAASGNQVEHYVDLTSFPSVRQDLAVVIADDLAAAEVIGVVREAGGPLLADVSVFDRFAGEQIGVGRVSLALSLEFRVADRTLTDDEVGRRREKIIAALRDRVGGELRG